MIRKIFLFTLFLAFLVSFSYFTLNYLFYKNKEERDLNQEISIPETTKDIEKKPTSTPFEILEPTSGSNYSIVWLIVRDTDKINLFSNLEKNLTARDAIKDNFCEHLISASFYSIQTGHIGLFVSEGKEISSSQQNKTFNGFFSIDYEGNSFISSSEPVNPKIAIQSGPILMIKSKPQSLKLENDENARRIILATTRKKEVVFIVIYDKSNAFSGPLLSEVPQILNKLNSKTSLDLDSALNLDGGTHSAFISDLTKLNELSMIGSFFCIKP